MISTADPAEREAFEALRRVVAWRAGPTVAAATYPGDDRPPTDHERLLAMTPHSHVRPTADSLARVNIRLLADDGPAPLLLSVVLSR